MIPIFVTGTDTGVGKTWVASLLIRGLRRRGHRVGAYKPACSGAETAADGTLHWEDLDALAAAVDDPDLSLDAICPQRFAAPLAPPLAAAREGRDVNRSLLTTGIDWWRSRVDVLVIEGAGGIHCPMTHQTTLADILAVWRFPTVIVSANRLGTINHTLLTIEAIRSREIPLLGFIMNDVGPHLDRSARDENITEIVRRGRVACLAHVDWEQREMDVGWTQDVLGGKT